MDSGIVAFGGVALIGVMAVAIVLICLPPKKKGDGLLHCPECSSTKLMKEPFGVYAEHFVCENGHRFHVDI